MIALIVSRWKVIFLALLLVMLGLQELRVSSAKTEAATARAELASDRARYAADAQLAEQAQRKIEAVRQAENERIAIEARNQVLRADADARRSADAGVGLRKQVAALLAARRAAGANSGPASGSATADPAPLFAELLGRIDDAAGKYAEAGDRARISGLACERAYQSLSEEVRP